LSNQGDWQVIRTDYGHWSEEIRQLSISPLLEKPIPLEELKLFLSGGATGQVRWLVPEHIAVFPKIGVCSWKCFPWLATPMPGINLFNYSSRRMRTVLQHWLSAGDEPVLRFFPAIDFTAVDEYRYLVSHGRISFVRKLLRKKPDISGGEEAARDLVSKLADLIDDILIDIAVETLENSTKVWVIELNPVCFAKTRT
jgi:hypothetical protein